MVRSLRGQFASRHSGRAVCTGPGLLCASIAMRWKGMFYCSSSVLKYRV
jgi:hypothetical protein